MAVRDHMSKVNKLRCTIVTVDPAQRLIEAVTADGGTRQISVWEVPTNFTWPVQGEQWTIFEENGYWYLGGKVLNSDEDAHFTDLSPGDTYGGSGGIHGSKFITQIEATAGLKISTGAGTGKVLTSDASGNATWQTPSWVPYTPTITTVTLGTGGTNVARYIRLGASIRATGKVTLGTGGSFTGADVTIGLPANVSGSAIDQLGTALAFDTSTGVYTGVVLASASGTTFITRLGNGSGATVALGATSPFTWGNGDTLYWTIEYEA